MRHYSQDRWRQFIVIAPNLREYIRRRVGSRIEADEIFQDLCFVVFRHHSIPVDIAQFSAWCRTLARHVLAHHVRTKRRRARLQSRAEFESARFEGSHYVDPERCASAREIRILGNQLDAEAIDLLSQRYLEGDNAQEIARRLAQSPAAVRMRLMRLRSLAKRNFA